MSFTRYSVYQILLDNRNLLSRMRDLNQLAGREVFPVPSKEELAAHLKTALGDAKCMSEVQNPEALRLAPIDEVLAAQVRAEYEARQPRFSSYHVPRNYPKIIVLGREVEVETYHSPARATLNVTARDNLFLLPDTGLSMSDGTIIELRLTTDHWNEIGRGTDIASLKKQCRAEFIKRAFEMFCKNSDCSEITIPNFVANPDATVPEILERQLCFCPETGKPVLVYGTLAPGAKKTHWWERKVETAGPTMHAAWFIEKAEAEGNRRCVEGLVTESRAKLKRKHGYKEQAAEVHLQLDMLVTVFSAVSPSSEVLVRLKQQLSSYGELNLNRDARVLSWTTGAQEYVQAGYRSLLRNKEDLAAVVEMLMERLMEAPAGQAQEQALEAVSNFDGKRNTEGVFSSIEEGTSLLQAAWGAVASCKVETVQVAA